MPSLQKLLENLKENLKRCLEKRKELTRSEASDSTLPNLMMFLHDRTANKPTDTNIPLVQIPCLEEVVPYNYVSPIPHSPFRSCSSPLTQHISKTPGSCPAPLPPSPQLSPDVPSKPTKILNSTDGNGKDRR